MKRLTTIVSFLFLTSLVFTSGLFLIRANAQFSSGGNLLNANPPRVSAGSDRNAYVGELFELMGEAVDDGVITGLGWTLAAEHCQISATSPFDINTSKARASAIVICAAPGEYTATLTAIDNTQAYASDTVVIVIIGSTSGTSTQPTQICGNGVAEGSEECDLSDLRVESCVSRGFSGGTLSCRTDCRFETSACTNEPAPDTTSSSTSNTDTNTTSTQTNTNTSSSGSSDTGTANTNTAQPASDTTEPTFIETGIAPAVRTTGSRDATEGATFTIIGEARDDRSLEHLAWEIQTTNCIAGQTSLTRISRQEARAEITIRCLPGTYVATLLAIDNEGLRSTERTTLLIQPKSTSTTISPLSTPTEPAPTGLTAVEPAPGVFNNTEMPPTVTTVAPPPPTTETPVGTGGSSTGSPVRPQVDTRYYANTFGVSDEPRLRDYQQYCLQRNITDAERCRAFIATSFPRECVQAGKNTPTGCDQHLRTLAVAKRCADEQIAADACEDTILRRYRSELHCGSLSSDDCGRIVKERLLGTVTTIAEERGAFMNALDASVGTHATVGEIVSVIEKEQAPRELLPLIAESNRTVIVRDSDRTIDVSNAVTAEATTPYLIIMDDDGDGLPNDVETLYGSDIKNSDSDNDGFTDRDEISNGYDPVKAGGALLLRRPSSVELALINAPRMEQPVTKGEVDTQLAVTNVTTAIEDGVTVQRLVGTAEPDSIVLIYIYSRMPLVLTVRTDSSGNWVYTLKDGLVEGKHDVYVAVTNETGQIVKKSQPGNFFIRGAQAVSVENFLATEARAATQTPVAERNSNIRSYVIGGISIMILGLALMWFLIARKRANA